MLNFLFEIAGAIVYRIVHEYKAIEAEIEGGERVVIGLANGDDEITDSDGDVEAKKLPFGFSK